MAEEDEFQDAVGASSSDPMVSAVGDSHTVGVFLEEVGYFLEDMKKDLWWLLKAAHQPSGEVFFRGNEELEEVSPETLAHMKKLEERFKLHVESHENQVRSKIAIIPQVTQEEMEVLIALRKLKFHCRGRIEVFLCMKEANNAAIWGAYHAHVEKVQPQWIVPSDGSQQKSTFAQCVMVVPIFVDVAKKEIKLLHVWCPDRKKRHWAFPGGDILRGVDNSIYDSARREFHDELGGFFGRPWNECFEVELPSDPEQVIVEPQNVQFISLEKDGVRYPCRPYYFAQVKEEFYDSTRAYEDAQGVIKLPTPTADFVRWDIDQDMATRLHVDGVAFAEHDEARWLNLDFDTGRLWSDDNRQLRRENVDLMKSQPEKIWRYFANLLGCAMPERAPRLPTDFSPDGPLAIRMSGIDKTATNEDITEFFESGGTIKTTLVKQFDIPKHTARVEFGDVAMLEAALDLSGHNLLRRKVKVEIWTEVGAEGGAEAAGARPLQEFTGTLPEEAPFKCMCRNLDRTVTRDCLGYFFWDRACLVHDVEFPFKGEKHAGCVEFQDQASLRKALSLNNAIFRGRELTMELPGPNDGKATAGGGGGGGGGKDRDRGDRKGKGGGKGKRDGDRGGYGKGDRDERPPPSREEFGSERPRLQLKPRSATGDGGGGGSFGGGGDRAPPPRDQPPNADRASKPNPFGGARPVDDRFKSTRADEDSNWRR